MNSVNKSLKGRIAWMDLVKFVAIFLMISNHCADNVTPAERSSEWYLVWGTFYNTFSRPAIPLFVMITGALLLPVKMSLNQFYKKRVLRVIVPFLIWSILYNLLPWFMGFIGLEPESIQLFFKGSHTLSFGEALNNIFLIPFSFSRFAVQMWYVYLLIGIYLYLPFFSTWLKNASLKEQHVFLLIWALSLSIPYVREYMTPKLWGECSWNEFGMLYNFAGFNGYLLLGYYLTHHPFKGSRSKFLAITIPLFLVGYFITYSGFKSIISTPNQPTELVELFFTFCSPNVLLMSIPVFMWCQELKSPSPFLKKFLEIASICTFGIWMCHYFLVGPTFLLVEQLPIHTLLKIFLTNILVLLFSGIFTFIVLKIKPIGKWIMG